MTAIGQRGKLAEGKVRAWMKTRSDADASFWFYRYPDARSGSFQAVPADFGALHRRVPFLLEVKEVDHDFRLPQKNFSADKVARMHSYAMAGGECWVIVYHTTTKLWRLVPLVAFLERTPSWDLSAYGTYPKVGEVMEMLFGEK